MSCSGSAGMLFGMSWTLALGPVLLRTDACAHTKGDLLGLQVAMLDIFGKYILLFAP
jgi:hypothetical protein